MIDQLRTFYRQLEMLPIRKRIILYIACSLLAALVGFMVGFSVLPVPELGSKENDTGDNGNNGEQQVEALDFAEEGYIQQEKSSVYAEGTHKLFDREGRLLAVLINNRALLDLRFFENRWVAVEGEIEMEEEGEVPLVRLKNVIVR